MTRNIDKSNTDPEYWDKILEEGENGISNIDKIEGFYLENLNIGEKINNFELYDFNNLEKNIDLDNGLFEYIYNGKLIGKINFIIGEQDLLIKYIEKFTDTKGFGTLMYIDFFAFLKSKGIRKIKSEINSPEVQFIYSKLIDRGIVINTEEGYLIN